MLALAAPAGAQPAPPDRAAGAPSVELSQVKVVEAAIDSLPKQLKPFYKAHRAEMPSQALEPEFAPRTPERRFLVDRLLPFPFNELPRTRGRAQGEVRREGRGRRAPALADPGVLRAGCVEAMKAKRQDSASSPSPTCWRRWWSTCTRSSTSPTTSTARRPGSTGLYVRFTEKLPQWAAQRAQALARRGALPRRPEGVRVLDDDRRPTSGSTTCSTSRSWPSAASPATATSTSRTSRAASRRSCASGSRARPRTPAATGTRRGPSPAGPELQ